MLETEIPKTKKSSVIYLRIDTKKKLDLLRCYNESYDNIIKRLIYKRTFDVVNSQVVDLEPLTTKVNDDIIIQEKDKYARVKLEGTIGR